jgi:hypothetical protein
VVDVVGMVEEKWKRWRAIYSLLNEEDKVYFLGFQFLLE